MAEVSIDGSNALIIIGMHRSGTSLVASILHSAGLDVGKKLMSAHENNNAKGFFENLEFVRFHEQVLDSLGESRFGWTTKNGLDVPDAFAGQVTELLTNNVCTGAWGWKDPRTTLFLNFWARRLPAANFVFVYRRPWEVIDSLFRRGDPAFQDNPRLAVETWITYNQAICDFLSVDRSRGLLAGVQSIVDEPDGFVSEINQRFGMKLSKPSSEIFDESLIERSTQDTEGAVITRRFFPEAIELYEKLIRESDFHSAQSKKDLEGGTIDDTMLSDCFLSEWSGLRRAERELRLNSKALYEARSELFHANETIQAQERSRIWKLRNIVHRLRQKQS